MIYVYIKVIKGYEFIAADVKMLPQTTAKLDEEGLVKSMNKMIDMMEDDDDIQEVFHNWEMEE